MKTNTRYMMLIIGGLAIVIALVGLNNKPKANNSKKYPDFYFLGHTHIEPDKKTGEFVERRSTGMSLFSAECVAIMEDIDRTRRTNGCYVKGNVSYYTGELIYHMPGDYYYNDTVAEEWFCSEAEAKRAGYRRTKY